MVEFCNEFTGPQSTYVVELLANIKSQLEQVFCLHTLSRVLASNLIMLAQWLVLPA